MTRAPRTLLVATVASLALASACGDDDGQESDAEPSRQPVLEVGSDGGPTCLLVEEELAAEVEELPVVDCDIEHTHEIYATVEYRGRGVYPGIEALETFAQTQCLKRFEPFVGISPFDSELSFSWLLPSLDGWNDQNDRDVVCALSGPDGNLLSRTMRNSRR